MEECRTLGGCKTGDAKITKGYNLPAKYVIHTVGPVWHGGTHNEENLLSQCYKNSLKLAIENSIKTIAFPSISTGVYRFPIEKACRIALKEFINFLSTPDGEKIDKVVIVCFDDNTLKNYNTALHEIMK